MKYDSKEDRCDLLGQANDDIDYRMQLFREMSTETLKLHVLNLIDELGPLDPNAYLLHELIQRFFTDEILSVIGTGPRR